MPTIPIVVVLTGAAVAAIPQLRNRVVPVTKAVAQAGAGVAGAALNGAGAVASAVWHGQSHPDAPRS
jgi:hypothetical protein